MTENKQLKARIRARMARTGESYTTAHRHVLASRPASPPSGVVPGYTGFTDYRHRPSALTSRLLSQVGCEVSEVLACGLGGGIGFMYAVFEYKQVAHPLLTIVAQHHPQPWLEAAAGHLGVELSTQHSTSTTSAVRKLDTSLDTGAPAQILVARGLLPWHTAADPMEAADPYPIVVAGAVEDSYVIDDLPDGPHLLERESLAAAWAAHRKGRHEMTTVAAIPETVEPHAVRSALRMTADHLDGPVLGNSFDVNFGFSGMAKLATELRDARTKAGWTRRFGDPAGFRYATARLAECLTSAYTADGGTRPLYAEFLTEASTMLGSPALASAAEAVAEAAAQWRGLAGDALASSTSDRAAGPSVEAFAALAERVEAAAAHERRAVDLLRDALSAPPPAAPARWR